MCAWRNCSERRRRGLSSSCWARSMPATLSGQPVLIKTDCSICGDMYAVVVPKLWTATIDEHRAQVRDAILDAAATLIGEQGLLSLTMSQIAERAEIGRATLYKYFPDVESILLAWHERQVSAHLSQLAHSAEKPGVPLDRLHAVLAAYAEIARDSHGHHGAGITSFLHRGEHIAHAEQALKHLVSDLIAHAVDDGAVRPDINPDELANYCLHALNAAAGQSHAAARRLVDVTLVGLRTH